MLLHALLCYVLGLQLVCSYVLDSEAYRNGQLGAYPNITYSTHPGEFPVFNFDREPTDNSTEYILLAPRGGNVSRPGALILNGRGELVWDGTEYGETMAFSVQTYLGNQVLAVWTGEFFSGGYGRGNVLLLDQTYTVVANISTSLADQGDRVDFHEFQITPEDTALILVYQERDDVISGIVQEINITSKQALFTWNSLDHISPSDCFADRTDEPWDWIHLNSVEKDPQGNFLISSRHCHAVYYVHPNGTILWTLGGKNSTYAGTTFAWQHDARWHGDKISLFDNAASTWTTSGPTAMGLFIELDNTTMTAKETAFDAPTNEVSPSQGNFQLLPNGNWLAGFGSEPYFTEFAPNGTALWTVQFGVGETVSSYRAVKANWTGYPTSNPSTSVTRGDENTTVLVSWSGATEVNYWVLLADNSEVGRTEHQSFEDLIQVRNTALDGRNALQVAGYSTNGSALGWSDQYILSDGTTQTATQTRTIGTATFAPQATQTPVGDRSTTDSGADMILSGWKTTIVAILLVFTITL